MPEFSPRSMSEATIGMAGSSPEPECDLEIFETPEDEGGGVLACKQEEIVLDGQLVRRVYAEFEIKATFGNVQPADCAKCEYRQYVRGFNAIKHTDGTWSYHYGELAPGVFLSPTEFREDGNNLIGGKWRRYGHRGDPQPDYGTTIHPFEEAWDQYWAGDKPDRLNGCVYRAKDRPSAMAQVQFHKGVRKRIFFRGKIITKDGNGNQVDVAVRNWRMDCRWEWD
jgi:hypothetical protein